MKSLTLFALVSVVLTPVLMVTSVANPSVKDNAATISQPYDITNFAKYMGMTSEEYYKFSGAYGIDNTSSMLPDFIDLQSHSAFIESQNLLASGLEVPESLTLEIEAMFKKNQELFAGYMGMDISELVRKQKQFEQLTTVINRLESVRLRQHGVDSSDPFGPLSAQVAETEVITIISTEPKIEQTASGIHTSLTTTIWSFGMGLNGGLGATFRVEFRTSNGYYGSQDWYVDRFRYYSTGNIFCDSEQCSLNPF
jgi:hypothetical protein